MHGIGERGKRSSLSEPPVRRVLILSADVGEGHDAAARTLAADLARDGLEVTVRDGLAALGKLVQRFVRDGSRIQFERYPWAFGPVYGLLMYFAPARWAAQRLLYVLGSRGLLRVIAEHRPDAIVSTYPGLTAILGRLRRRGRLEVPACSAILDLTSFPFWAHRGVDHHFVMHAPAVGLIERIAGRGGVRHVEPVIGPEFLDPRDPAEARRALDLPAEGRVVVVAGGGWGIGDIEGAVEVALELEATTVVAVAGRNDALRARLEHAHRGDRRVRVLGFTDRMSDLLAAADALVHPGGGVTTLEALARGCPAVIYAPPPGHWRANARAMGRLGVAHVARGRVELRDALEQAAGPRGAPHVASAASEAAGRGRAGLARTHVESRPPTRSPAPTAAALVRRLAPRIERIPRWRLAAGRAGVTLMLTIALTVGVLSTDETYVLATGRFAKLRPLNHMPVREPMVGVVVRASPDSAPVIASRLAGRGVRVTFTDTGLGRASVARLEGAGDEVLPELRPSELSRWVATRAYLRRKVEALSLPRRFFYLAPRRGATLGQYALARSVGGSPVTGKRRLPATLAAQAPAPGRGDVLVFSAATPAESAELERYLVGLDRRGLEPVPLRRLAGAAEVPPEASRDEAARIEALSRPPVPG